METKPVDVGSSGWFGGVGKGKNTHLMDGTQRYLFAKKKQINTAFFK